MSNVDVFIRRSPTHLRKYEHFTEIEYVVLALGRSLKISLSQQWSTSKLIYFKKEEVKLFWIISKATALPISRVKSLWHLKSQAVKASPKLSQSYRIMISKDSEDCGPKVSAGIATRMQIVPAQNVQQRSNFYRSRSIYDQQIVNFWNPPGLIPSCEMIYVIKRKIAKQRFKHIRKD